MQQQTTGQLTMPEEGWQELAGQSRSIVAAEGRPVPALGFKPERQMRQLQLQLQGQSPQPKVNNEKIYVSQMRFFSGKWKEILATASRI